MKRCASSSDISVNGCKALGALYYLPAREIIRRPARAVLLPVMLTKTPAILGLLQKSIRRVDDYPRCRLVCRNKNFIGLVSVHMLNTIEHKNKIARTLP